MIQAFSLDPSSLALWCDQETLGKLASKESLMEAVSACLFDTSDVVERAVSLLPHEDDKRLVRRLAGTIWHEQRHFLDLMLTNYGAFRVRQFLTLYVNMGHLFGAVRSGGDTLVCPLDAYLDPVRRHLLGIDHVPEGVQQIAKEARDRESMVRNERQAIPFAGQNLAFGGDAQLEALGFLFQQGAVSNIFGADAFADLEGTLPHVERNNLRYRWIFLVADALGLTRESSEGRVDVDAAFLGALLIAGLASRRWGQEQSHTADGLGSGYCAQRLKGLFETLKKMSVEPFQDPSKSWEQVNEAARLTFGRTVVEEMREDYAREEKWLGQVLALPGLSENVSLVCKDYHVLRGRLLKLFEEGPLFFTDPLHYSFGLVSNLKPITIMSAPGGVLGKAPKGWDMVSGYQEAGSSSAEGFWWWSSTPSEPEREEQTLALTQWKAWIEIIEWRAPIAKLLMKGRAHRTQFGPELIAAEMRLKAGGTEIRFDPLFAFPRDMRVESSAFFLLTGKAQAVCDVCRSNVLQGSGWILSPWLFRKHTRLAQQAIEALGGGEIGRLKFIRDWSVWLVCDVCDAKWRPLTEN